MRNSKVVIFLSVLLPVGMSASLQASELQTLFTTPDERQLINSDRYQSDAVVEAPVQFIEEVPDNPLPLLIQEEVTREYQVSGITVSRDGPHTVWINSQVYQDGDEIDTDTPIKVLIGDDLRVRITAPDGKHYYALSGETLELTYLTAVSQFKEEDDF